MAFNLIQIKPRNYIKKKKKKIGIYLATYGYYTQLQANIHHFKINVKL